MTPRALLWAGVFQAAAGGLLLLVAATSGLPLAVVLVGLFAMVSTIGLISPNAIALALEDHAEAAGSAASLLGVSQLAIGALLAPVVGLFRIRLFRWPRSWRQPSRRCWSWRLSWSGRIPSQVQ